MAVEKGEKGAMEVDEEAAVAAKEVINGDMITLKSSDGKTFEVSKEAAERLSKFLKEKISGGSIQLEKIGSEALEKVIDYFNKHANNSDPSGISFVDTPTFEDLKEWDRKLVDNLT
jgi:S-phase kinase-associated protein 1